MNKLLFVLAFAFIGQQAVSQIYLVTLSSVSTFHPSGCNTPSGDDLCLTKTDPTGAQTYTCISNNIATNSNSLSILNTELNTIVNQGYKLIEIKKPSIEFQHSLFQGTAGSFLQGSITYNIGTTWYFAIP